jgi:hypothetical protein
VRKNLSGYLQSKYNKDNSFPLRAEPTANHSVPDNKQVDHNESIENYIAKSETNIPRKIPLISNNQGLRIINYDSNESINNQKSNDYIVEYEKDTNPYSEIEKYDKLLLSDKPYNYFTNYPMTYKLQPSKDYVTHENLDIPKGNLNNQPFQRVNNIQFYNKADFSSNRNDESSKVSSSKIGNIKLEENYQIEPKEDKNISDKALLKFKVEQRIYSKPVQTGNTSISNLTAIPSKSLFKSRT